MIDKLIGREVKINGKTFRVFAAELTSRGPQALLLCPDNTLIWSDLSGVELVPDSLSLSETLHDAAHALHWADNVLSAGYRVFTTNFYPETPLGKMIAKTRGQIDAAIKEQSK